MQSSVWVKSHTYAAGSDSLAWNITVGEHIPSTTETF